MSTIKQVPKDYPREVIGYATPWIASPGDEIEIKVSCTEPEYTYRIVRVTQGYEAKNSPPARREEVAVPGGTAKGRFQVAPIGSYAEVVDVGILDTDKGIEVTVHVQPWLMPCEHVQTLFSNLDAARKTGIAALLTPQGAVEVWVGTGKGVQVVPSNFTPVKKRWLRIDLKVFGRNLELLLTPQVRGTEPCGKPVKVNAELDGDVQLSTTALLMAASRMRSPHNHEQLVTPENKFNGRLDSFHITALRPDPQVLAKYDFAVEIPSDDIYDVSGNGRHGVLVNAPTRAVKGHDWDGREPDWTRAKYGYGAIHFHEDDLDDACWETDFRFTLPEDARSGVYAAELRYLDGSIAEDVTFFVRPTESTTASIGAKVAIVLSTFTYLAYANEHQFDPDSPARCEVPGGLDSFSFYKDETFFKQDRRRDLGLAHYDVHKDHSPVAFSSAKRPLLNCRPNYVNWTGHRPRELSSELIMIGYLDQCGIPYDVVTDHDLHLQGVKAVGNYTTLITGCHPEYPTIQSYTAYEDFVKQGGNLMYLGGNGFYWVSATDPGRPWRSEVRRGGQGVRTSWQEPGERVHSLNGQVGGLWRDNGKAANYLVGIGCCGEGAGPGVAYRRKQGLETDNPDLAAWLFRGIPEGELLGENALGGYGGGASADEIDRADFTYGSPSNIVVVASSIGHPDAFGLFPEDVGFPITDTLGTQTDKIRSDMVYYETSGGGAVFSVGSISWYCALGWNGYDNNIAVLTRNVLTQFMKGKRGLPSESN